MSTLSSTSASKTFGVLGGMGPQASLHFYQMAIDYSVECGAHSNATFPHFFISNLPVPDFIDDRTSEEKAIRMVEKEARVLEKAGAEFLVIACNTMHLHIDRFRKAVTIPILSMIDVVVDTLEKEGHSKIGFLGTPTAVRSGLYAHPLEKRGITVLVPEQDDQKTVTECILKTIAGQDVSTERGKLDNVIERLKSRGAEAILLGCTELPLIAEGSIQEIPVYSSSALLARHAVEEAMLNISLPTHA